MQSKKSQGHEFEFVFTSRYNSVRFYEPKSGTLNRTIKRELAGFARNKFGNNVEIEFHIATS